MRKRGINTALHPPLNSEDTGESVTWGGARYHVQKQLLPLAMRSKVVEELDGDGKPLFHYDPLGRPTRRKRHRELLWPDPNDPSRPDLNDPRNFRELIMVSLRNGNSEPNYHFREDPEVRARLEKEAERKRKWERLMDAVDPDALEAALAGQES